MTATPTCDDHLEYKGAHCPGCGEEVDQYGNTPSSFRHCCFPDCGCDGARHCTAPSGASLPANTWNLDKRRWEVIHEN